MVSTNLLGFCGADRWPCPGCAGIYVAPGMLPADPEMALEGEFEALRRAAPAFLPVYQVG